MIQLSVFDILDGHKQRDAGIKAVMSHNSVWADNAFAELEFFSQQKHHLYWKSEFTPTDIRIWLSACDVEPPDHPNAWGGFTQRCIREGLIVETDLPWRKTGAHARRQPVYRWRSL